MKDGAVAFLVGVIFGLACGGVLLWILTSEVVARSPAQAWTLYLEQRELEAQRHSEAMGGTK